jgi:hypothetical protein
MEKCMVEEMKELNQTEWKKNIYNQILAPSYHKRRNLPSCRQSMYIINWPI